jgi:queuine tRNA-ribosyltransferase
MNAARFEVIARDPASLARAGVIRTAHGPLPTPAFAPVATQGAVKAASPRDLTDLGVHLVMCNAYHLAMRPGSATVADLGGLHRLAGWDGPLMTDSGGYQVFSLASQRDVDADGVTFRSPVDGATHRFTPEGVVEIQAALGADLVMPLDVCTGYPATHAQAAREMDLTHAWAARARRAHTRGDQVLYGIVQGSTYPDLRAASAREIAEIGFEAFAVGGVSVGESKADMLASVEGAVPLLPDAAPRHLLGVGHPEDIVEAVARGIDTFDCVVPTRWARNGAALTMAGRLNLRNAVHASDTAPVESDCGCYGCRRFSRGAIRHLLKSDEILGLHLLTLHNLHFIVALVDRLRRSILDGTFPALRVAFLTTYDSGRFALDTSHPGDAPASTTGTSPRR